MTSKFLFAVLTVLLATCRLQAQSADILAKSAMLNAEEAYSNENYDECFIYLSEAEKTLGKTNSRIQYLKVKAWMAVGNNSKNNLTAWQNAETELKKYFDITPENTSSTEKYDEMVMAVSKIKKAISEIETAEKAEEEKILRQKKDEEDYYNSIKTARNKVFAYKVYLQKFPTGNHTEEAKTEVEKFLKSWMTKNLDTDHYSNGDEIPEVGTLDRWNKKEWSKLTSGAWISGRNLGNYYNGYAVKDKRGLCPSGWHVPTIEEWQTLVYILGGQEVAGGKLKEKGVTNWKSPNLGATDEIGFCALPCGYLSPYEDTYYYIMKGEAGCWWSSEGNSVYIDYESASIIVGAPQTPGSGLSVRCVRDSQKSANEVTKNSISRPAENVTPKPSSTDNSELVSKTKEADKATNIAAFVNIVNTKTNSNEALSSDEEVYFTADKMPEFPGGEAAMNKYIADNMKYPEIAKANGITGKVYLRFVITSSGSVKDIQILRRVDPSLDNEAVRIVGSFPRFSPGIKNGKPVDVSYNCTIEFK